MMVEYIPELAESAFADAAVCLHAMPSLFKYPCVNLQPNTAKSNPQNKKPAADKNVTLK